MNHALCQEFRTFGFEVAKSMSARLQNHGFRPGSIAPQDVGLWVEAVTAWVSGFLNGWGLQEERVNVSLARSVTAFRRFYMSETTKS
jgi:uncharacterized protein YgfB (UPF0149 family)